MAKNKKQKKNKLVIFFLVFSILILIFAIFSGAYWLVLKMREDTLQNKPGITEEIVQVWKDNDKKLEQAKLEAAAEQERLRKEMEERRELIAQADQLALGYDYDGAVELIKSYQGKEGDYRIYTELIAAIDRLKTEKEGLLLYGGSYHSASEINHLFFHILVADNSLAFDGDSMSKGYNMYMTTISEFKKIIQKMYEEGYVLVRMSDLVRQVTEADGTTKFVQNEIYLREGKKPFVLSEDDVCYYDYMKSDGFASRLILDEKGKPTCERTLNDGEVVTGDFDIVPILDAFIEEHPDFSYRGAKGLLAVTGYEGILGYRTNDKEAPTYEEDLQAARKVVEALKAEGWEFGSHSWGHKNMQKESLALLKRDTKRWLEEVGAIVGPTNIYVFPFGIDIETTIGSYKSEKFTYLKESGFDLFIGVYKEPWMQIKKDYVRMTRRPVDGQAMLEFPERLADLFEVKDIIDPERPPRDW